MAPLILTAAFDPATQAVLESLRRAHFPPERNLVPAHCTLFHALPGAEDDAIRARLSGAAAEGAAVLGPPRFTGRGVALAVAAPGLAALRAALAAEWRPWLSAQDAQAWRPHVTVQNKAPPDAARALHARLSAEWAPRPAQVEALLLWRYLGGPWEAAGRFPLTP